MKCPYDVCAADECTAVVCDTHHAPSKGQGLHLEDYDNPLYHRKLCRRHHSERELVGYKAFKLKYPQYHEITITEYREAKRNEAIDQATLCIVPYIRYKEGGV